jgi:hypothetical protein
MRLKMTILPILFLTFKNIDKLREMINALKILVRKPEGKRPLGKTLVTDRKIIVEWILGK